MPGLGRRTFAPGEVLTATNVMGYLQDQAVMNFAGTAARGSAIGTAVSEGMVSYLADSNTIETYSGSVWERQTPGLVPIAPSSIVVATGTATANALGTVTFSGATSLSLNGVFTSMYRNYFFVVDFTGSTALELRLRLRTASDDTTSTTYQTHAILWGSDGGNLNYADNAAAGFSRLTVSSGTYKSHFNTIVADPNNAVQTNLSGRFSYRGSGGVHFDGVYGGNTTTTTQYTGFTIYPSTGNVTGTITVYGYNN